MVPGRFIVMMPPSVAEPIRAFGCAKHKVLAKQILDHPTDRVTVKPTVIDRPIILKEPHHGYCLLYVPVCSRQPCARGYPKRLIKGIDVSPYLIRRDEVLQKNKSQGFKLVYLLFRKHFSEPISRELKCR